MRTGNDLLAARKLEQTRFNLPINSMWSNRFKIVSSTS